MPIVRNARPSKSHPLNNILTILRLVLLNARVAVLNTHWNLLMFAPRIRSVLFSLIALVICLPVVALILSWLEWNATSSQVLQEMAQTVLPDYAVTSLLLCLGVAAGVTVLGTSTAAAVTLFKFPGHSFLNGRCYFPWPFLPMWLPMPTQIFCSSVALCKTSSGCRRAQRTGIARNTKFERRHPGFLFGTLPLRLFACQNCLE